VHRNLVWIRKTN